MLAAVFEGADEDVAAGGGGEDGEPLDDGGGDEVGFAGLVDEVAGAHLGGDGGEAELRGQVRSQAGAWERGGKGILA